MGHEAAIRDEVERRREAQLAAMLESGSGGAGEVLTFSPAGSTRDRWLERTVSEGGERLAWVRDALFELAAPSRHHLVLDLNAGTGLLTWEAVRRTPEGQVWALEQDAAAFRTLEQQAERLADRLGELARPVVLNLSPAELEGAPFGEVRFDVVVGLNALALAGGGQACSTECRRP